MCDVQSVKGLQVFSGASSRGSGAHQVLTAYPELF